MEHKIVPKKMNVNHYLCVLKYVSMPLKWIYIKLRSSVRNTETYSNLVLHYTTCELSWSGHMLQTTTNNAGYLSKNVAVIGKNRIFPGSISAWTHPCKLYNPKTKSEIKS